MTRLAEQETRASGGSNGLLDHPGVTRWGAHAAFWLIYFIVRTAAAAADPPEDVHDFPYLANRALVVASYAVLTGVLLAIIANLFVAALGGILAPIVLDRLGRDPAVSSSVVVTFMTDLFGFLALLGIAALILL